MYELHENEQYFFAEPTLAHLATFLRGFTAPCCLCTPLVGRRLAEQGVAVTILDIDERFATVRGFHRYNLYNPEWLDREFDIIVCDPPFFNVSLSQLFAAIRLLSHHRFDQPLLISYLQRRSSAILGAFAPFGLQATGYLPRYQTVQPGERNQIEFFGNLAAEQLVALNNMADPQLIKQ